jgi:chemotaxis protein CheX
MPSDATPRTILKLPKVLDLNAAGRLHEQVLAHRGADIDVDASEVVRVGAQCIQVLLSAVMSWRAENLRFKVESASNSFVNTLDLLGISDEALLPKEMLK